MRRAFTLVELLVIIAIVATMVSIGVLSVTAGQAAARMKGAVRGVFATIRQARSIALVTKQPSIITFSTTRTDGEVVSRAEITSAKLVTDRSLMTSAGRAPRSIGGYGTLPADGDAAPADTRQAFVVSNREDDAPAAEPGGHTVEEALFRPMDEEVLAGVGIHVVMEDEEGTDDGGDEARRAMVSTFSNVDMLLGLYRKYRDQRQARAQEDAAETPASPAEVLEEERHIRWQSNGRTDPHAVYVYAEGDEWSDGWCVKVDMYGAARVISDGEDD